MIGLLQDIYRRWLYIIIWFLGYIPISLMVRVTGMRHLPHKSNAVLISNHEAFMDSPMMCMLVPLRQHLRWVGKNSIRSVHAAKEEFGELEQELQLISEKFYSMLRDIGRAIIFFVARNTGTIVVKKGESTVQRVIKILQNNPKTIIGIFPTGARKHIEPEWEPRSGFIAIATKAEVPVIPVAFYRVGLLRWHMRVFAPISPADLQNNRYGTTNQQRATTIMHKIDRYIDKTCPVYENRKA